MPALNRRERDLKRKSLKTYQPSVSKSDGNQEVESIATSLQTLLSKYEGRLISVSVRRGRQVSVSWIDGSGRQKSWWFELTAKNPGSTSNGKPSKN